MLLLAIFALVQAVPQQGPIKAFGAWVVACDNVKRCEMTSIWPEDSLPDGSPYGQVSVSIVRDAGPTGTWSVEIQLPANAGNDTLRVTTERGLDVRALPRKDLLRITGADAATVVAAMVDGADLRIGDETSILGMASLTGSSAALRFIDAEQGRVGTVTAAVAKGAKPASTVPGARALPRIAHIRPSGAAAPLSTALRKTLDTESQCGSNYESGEGSPPEAERFALGGGKTLLLLPCGQGAYNSSTEAFILAPGTRPEPAKFNAPVGYGDMDGKRHWLVNADFDTKTGELGSYSKGRGLGDCGSAESFVWDGAMFRMVEARSMPECRGSVNWLATWRAVAVPR